MTELYVKIVNELSARRERAQTMAEYAVVLALITVAIVAAITFLGTQIKSAITSVANTI